MFLYTIPQIFCNNCCSQLARFPYMDYKIGRVCPSCTEAIKEGNTQNSIFFNLHIFPMKYYIWLCLTEIRQSWINNILQSTKVFCSSVIEI